MHITDSIYIKVPAQKVFSFIINSDNNTLLGSNTEYFKVTKGTYPEVNSEFEIKAKDRGSIRGLVSKGRVIEFIEGSLFKCESTTPYSSTLQTISCTQTESGTKVTFTHDMKPKGLYMKLLYLLLWFKLYSENKKFLSEHLKNYKNYLSF